MITSIGHYGVATLVEKLLGFGILFVVLDHIDKSSYAVYGMYAITVLFAAMVLDFGQNAWLRLCITKKNYNFPELISKSLVISLLLYIPIMISGYYVLSGINDKLLIVFTIHTSLLYINLLIRGLFISQTLSKSYLIMVLTQSLIDLIVFILFSNFIVDLVYCKIVSWIFSILFACLLGIFLIKKSNKFLSRKSLEKPLIKDAFLYGLPIMLNGLSVTGVVYVERNILNGSVTSTMLADIFFAATLLSVLIALNDVIGKWYTAQYFRKMNQHDTVWIVKTQTKLLVFSACICFLFFLTAPNVLGLIAHGLYDTSEVRDLIMIISVYPFFSLLYQFQMRYFLYVEKIYVVTMFSITSSAIYVGSLYYISDRLTHVVYGFLYIMSMMILSLVLYTFKRLYPMNKYLHS